MKYFRTIEDQCWQHKSRIQWLRDGDLNTSFFHKVASARHRSNLITPTIVPLPDNVSARALRLAVTMVFMDRFRPSEGIRIVNWVTRFPLLDMSQARGLENAFTEAEIF